MWLICDWSHWQLLEQQSTDGNHSIRDWTTYKASIPVRRSLISSIAVLRKSHVVPLDSPTHWSICGWSHWCDWQRNGQQSTDGNHSIRDWIAYKASVLVRRDLISSIAVIQRSRLDPFHSLTDWLTDRYVIDLIDSFLNNNQLNGTIPSEIGLLKGALQVYETSSLRSLFIQRSLLVPLDSLIDALICDWSRWCDGQLLEQQSTDGNYSVRDWIAYKAYTTVRRDLISSLAVIQRSLLVPLDSLTDWLTDRYVVDLVDVMASYLNSNQLTGAIPSEIGSLGSLQLLYDESSSPTRDRILNHWDRCHTKESLWSISLTHSLIDALIDMWLTENWIPINWMKPFHQSLDCSQILAPCTRPHRSHSKESSCSLQRTRSWTHSFATLIDWYVVGFVDVINRDLNTNQLMGAIPSELGLLSSLLSMYETSSLSYKGIFLLRSTHSLTISHDISLTHWLICGWSHGSETWIPINWREPFHQSLECSSFKSCTNQYSSYTNMSYLLTAPILTATCKTINCSVLFLISWG